MKPDDTVDRRRSQAMAQAADAYARAVRAKCLADLDHWTQTLTSAAEHVDGRAAARRPPPAEPQRPHA